MSPLEIEVILNYYARPVDYGDRDNNGDCFPVTEAQRWFVEEGLLEENKYGTPRFKITDKGRAYVELGLTQVPFPESSFVIPWPKK